MLQSFFPSHSFCLLVIVFVSSIKLALFLCSPPSSTYTPHPAHLPLRSFSVYATEGVNEKTTPPKPIFAKVEAL